MGRSLPAAFPPELPFCLPGRARRWPAPPWPGPLPRLPPPPRSRPAAHLLDVRAPAPGRLRQPGPAPGRSPRAPAGALAVPFCSRLEPASN